MDNNVVFTPAEIKEIFGRAFVVNSKGRSVAAEEGLSLNVGDVLLTPEGSKVVVLINGEPVVVDQNCVSCIKAPEAASQEYSLESEQVAGQLAVNETVEEPELDIEAIQAAILAGEDPTQFLEATAAGGAAGGSANAGFITIEYDESSTIANIDFETQGFAHNAGTAGLEEGTDDVVVRSAAPIANVDETGITQEDSILSANGVLGVTNFQANLSYTWTISGSASGTYGSLQVDSTTGVWTYTLNNLDTVTQALAEGQTESEAFSVIVTDSAGGSDTQQVIISVLGTNDFPTISGTSIAELTEGDIGDSNPEVTEQLTVNDVDALDTHSWTIIGSTGGTYGDLSIDQTGEWKYTLDNSLLSTQGLVEGQKVDETFQVQVSDGHGGTAVQQVIITIVGTNDLPVIEGKDSGVAVEDLIVQASGKLNLSDLDDGDNLTGTISDPNGTYGVLSYDNATTTWTYDLSNSTVTQALNKGQTETEQFTIVVTDSFGGQTSQLITITVTGTNDLPEITDSSVIAGSVVEDDAANLQATGQLDFTDADAETGHTWQVLGANNSPYGDFSVDGSGEWTFNLTNGADEVQALGVGVTQDLFYTVEVKDPQGATDTVTVKITITGSNDEPSISGTHLGNVVEDTLNSATGTLTSTDADAGDSATWSITAPAGTYGDLTQVDGTWTYNLNNNKTATQALNKDEIQTDVFEVVVTDSDGAQAKQTVTITVTGTNDLPEITNTSVVEGDVVEDDVANLQATGQLDFTDADAETGHTWQLLGANNSPYGDFSVDGSGEWTFNLTTGADEVQALGVGVTQDLFYTVEVKDPQGATDTVTVKITITGSNDEPTISGTHLGDVVEDTLNIATGTLTSADVDVGDSANWSITTPAGTYGNLTNVNGTWTYTLDNTKPATQALAEGEKQTDVFEMVVSDGKGGSDSQTITITVTGTNDDPVIDGGNDSGEVVEDGALIASDTLTLTDDNGDTHQWSLVGNTSSKYGSITIGETTGTWTYTLNNDAAQELAVTDILTEQYVVQADDGKGGTVEQIIEITIKGTNDTPLMSGVLVGSITEDESPDSITGQLLPDDIDNVNGGSDTHIWLIAGEDGTYGTIGIDDDGLWTYELDNTKDSVQKLGEGVTATEIFNVTVTDNHGASTTKQIVITITGSNDIPSIKGAITTSTIEDVIGKDTGTGDLVVVDIDQGDTHSWEITGEDELTGIKTGIYGDLQVDDNGTWFYQLDNDRPATDAIPSGVTESEVFTIEVIDQHGAKGTIEVTIHVAGHNTDPNISGTLTGTVIEDATPDFVEGTALDGDLDLVDDHGWEIIGSTGSFGELTLNNDGTWKYKLDNNNSKVDELDPDDTLEDIIAIRVVDSFGQTSESEIKITIEGANDVPVLSGALSGSINEDTKITTSGQLSHGDPDKDDIHDWSLDSGVGVYGNLTLDSNNKWHYTLTNTDPTIQALGVGDTLTETFNVTVEDSHGEVSSKPITITINGTNDVPTIEGGADVDYIEDVSDTSITGQLLTHDIDGDTVTFTPHEFTGTFGRFSLGSDGSWSYLIDKDLEAVQSLNEGETHQETFPVSATDGNGGTVNETITINIIGTNDIPVISGADEGAVAAGDQFADFRQSSGQLNAHDVDLGDTIVSWQAVDGQGIYGSFTVDADGKWTHTLDNVDPDTLALVSGDEMKETFQVTATDSHGGVSLPQTVIIDVLGTSSPNGGGDNGSTILDPIIINPEEDRHPDESGQIDLDQFCGGGTGNGVGNDNNNGHHGDGNQGQGGGNGGGTGVIDTVTANPVHGGVFGQLVVDTDGNWTYVLDNNSILVDSLCEGDQVTETWKIQITDTCGETYTIPVTITITGSNDAPIIGGLHLGDVTEDTQLSFTGELEGIDPDKCDDQSWTVDNANGNYGSLVLNPTTGEWTYTLDPKITDPNDPNYAASQVIQELDPGDSIQETFQVTVTDNYAESATQEVIVTIHGTADDVTITDNIVAVTAFEEDGTLLTDSGNLTTPVGLDNPVTWSAVNGSGSYGLLTLTAGGE
ncbi:MAG: retention module-containing protein, partial [Aliivibrio sp.]|uniref:retention module-containing protein n=1 Tax=Aliivibrio sp. TaxID=1872443 RepID=UPI001A3FB3AF|nr:retention module-containing protein [Aliivibrio sp.]